MQLNAPEGSDAPKPSLLDPIRMALIAMFVFTIPFAIQYLTIVDVHSPYFSFTLLGTTTTGPFDLLLALIAISAVPLIISRSTYRDVPIGLVGVLGFAAATVIWALVDPTPHGVARGLRLMGIAGVIVTIRSFPLRRFIPIVVWPLAATASIQAVWALLQTFVWRNGDTSGITARFNDAWTHGHGTMDGGYALAAFLVLSIAIILASGAFQKLHPVMWVTIVLSSAAVSTTYGRLGVLGLAGIALFYGIGAIAKRSKEYAGAVAASTVPVATGIAITWTAWSVRAAESAVGFQSGRESLTERAWTIINAHRLLGVGPGEYGPTLARIGLTDADVTVVHNVGLLLAAEYGIPFALLFVAWLGIVGLASVFTSWRAMALYASIFPYLVFDHTHISYAYAMAGFGLWIAVLDYLRLHRHETRDSGYTERNASTDVGDTKAAEMAV